MDDREYWTKQLRAAEQELDAARTRTALSAAAKKLMLAKAQLKRLEAPSPPQKEGGREAAPFLAGS